MLHGSFPLLTAGLRGCAYNWKCLATITASLDKSYGIVQKKFANNSRKVHNISRVTPGTKHSWSHAYIRGSQHFVKSHVHHLASREYVRSSRIYVTTWFKSCNTTIIRTVCALCATNCISSIRLWRWGPIWPWNSKCIQWRGVISDDKAAQEIVRAVEPSSQSQLWERVWKTLFYGILWVSFARPRMSH